MIASPGGWNEAGDILFCSFAAGGSAVMHLSPSGGTPSPVTKPIDNGVAAAPQFLPDGRHFLYHVLGAPGTTDMVWVGSLDSNSPVRLMEIPNYGGPDGNSKVQYASPGYLLFSRERRLLARAFNVSTLAITRDAVPIAERVSDFTVSENGTLVYRSPALVADNSKGLLLWKDRRGNPAGEVTLPETAGNVKLSRDGQRIAFDTVLGALSDIWVIDSRGVPQKLVNSPAFDANPIWGPNDSQIAFAAKRSAVPADIYLKASNGVGAEEPLVQLSDAAVPDDWSMDGKFIVFDRYKISNLSDIDIGILEIGKKAGTFLATPSQEKQAQISPDGKYLAYTTNESGKYQVVVRTFPDPNQGKWVISSGGGSQPRWRRKDGGELYYLSSDGKVMAVAMTRGKDLVPGTPMELFPAPAMRRQPTPYLQQYDVTADGQRFLFAAAPAESKQQQSSRPIVVTMNWTGALKKN